jgi:hypothetical protein
MNIMFDQQYYGSLLLFLDNQILNQGQSYQNFSGFFYPINSYIYGVSAYNCGFRQIVSDTAISGANVMTGIYLNGNFVTPGTSGLWAINHSLATIYFTGNPLPSNTIISGNFAIKDFNTDITDQQEYDMLFNTQFKTNPQFNQVLSGIDVNTKVSPSLFLKFHESEYRPFAFTRIDDNRLWVRITIVTENEYQRVGVSNILKNLKLRTFPIVTSTPFDQMGNYTGILYNYNNLPTSPNYQPWIMTSKIISMPQRPFTEQTKNIERKIFLCDLSISCVMNHL